VHPDMKGQTGGVLSMGQGAVYSTSTRQKLVTRSSTESDLVGIHDVLPDILWTKNFLEAQGFPVIENVLHQDNQSCILLAKNGRQTRIPPSVPDAQSGQSVVCERRQKTEVLIILRLD
jgi:hypothetical protein